ncbi:NAD(P)-binding protein [Lizonia empirigonia]|nr:NAD(P)-binding protein [Lizonia empirigonia]
MFSANTNPYSLPANATWFISGCSSGIGKALASIIASKPCHRLVATAHKLDDLAYLPDDNPDILKLQLDVISPDLVKRVFEKAVEAFGTIDVLVNSAGYALSGDTDTVRTTLAAIPIMRKGARGGLVMNISSVAGVCAFPGHAFYHASKHAVEGWAESVAREMDQDWGISFCIVEPSAVKTNFEGHSKKTTSPHPAYMDSKIPTRMLQKYVDAGLKQGIGMEPMDVARVLYEVASNSERVPLHLPLSMNAFELIKGALEGRMKELEEVKAISGTLS